MTDQSNVSGTVSDRLAAMAEYGILDTARETAFDDLAALAAQVCATPIALVSLVDADRQWFKARVGFDRSETDLDCSVCLHALAEPDLLVIPDLRADPRTSANPLVTGPEAIRFYAGAPLRSGEGVAIGSLCVIDTRPRSDGLTSSQAEGLAALGRQVMANLELRKIIGARDATIASQRDIEQRNALADIRQAALLEIGDALRDCATAADMSSLASAITGRTLGATRVGFGRVEESGEHVTIEPDWTARGARSIEGRHRFADFGEIGAELVRGDPLVIEDVRTDPRTAADPGPMLALGIGSLVNMPVRDRGRTVAVFIVHDSEPRMWTTDELAFLRNVADRLEVGAARIEAEERQHILNQELAHRLKNTLSMVQAIATQTLRNHADRAPFDAFEARLQALATAHEVLLQRQWITADMRTLIENVLSTLVTEDQVAIDGPEVALGARAALSTSLVIHELCTNAAKYGALSVPDGRVLIAWGVVDDDMLDFRWIERNGPPAVEPTRRGFGSRLLQRGLLGVGGVTLNYDKIGFNSSMTAPIAELARS